MLGWGVADGWGGATAYVGEAAVSEFIALLRRWLCGGG